MKQSVFIGVLLFTFHNIYAQQARVTKYTTPLAGHAVLSEVDDKYNAEVFNLEMPDPDAAEEHARLEKIKLQISKQFPREEKNGSTKNKANKKTTALAPIIDIGYVADSLGGIPSDNYMAINRQDSSVSVINSTIATHNAQNGHMTRRKGLMSFSSSVGLNSPINDYRYDPKIVYDPDADRFICVMLNSTNNYNYIVVGFSTSSSPSAGWNFYKFYGDYTGDTTWFDYPAIGVSKNEFFLTGNKIRYDSSWQAGFKQTIIYEIKKQDGYDSNANLNYQIWDNIAYGGSNIRCIYPLNPGSSLQGPAQYFLSNRDFAVQNDSVFLIKIPDTLGSGNTNLTVTALAANVAYGVPPDGRQPDTSVTLATNDNRILGGFAEGNEVQFVCTSVDPANGNSGIYHGVISDYTTTPTVQGRLYSIDSLDLGYPNISYAGSQGGINQSIISFDYSGPHTYPGFGAIFFDGTQFSDIVNIRAGDSSIKVLQQKEQRWGDYSGSQPDWTSISTVWAEGIYGRKQKNYGDYIAHLSSPYFTRVTPLVAPKDESSLYPNPAWQYIRLEFEIPHEDLVSFIIYDAQGRKVDMILQHQCDEGKNMVQFNIASLVKGTYFLKATGKSNNIIATKSFIKE